MFTVLTQIAIVSDIYRCVTMTTNGVSMFVH